MAVRFIAPTGIQDQIPELEYTMLRNDRLLGKVGLVGFVETKAKKGKTERRAHFVRLPLSTFQRGLTPAKPGQPAALQPVTKTATLPGWLSAYEGKNLDAIPALTSPKSAKGNTEGSAAVDPDEEAPRANCPRQEVDWRIARISVAITEAERILTSDDPDFELNCLARKTVPATNETRYRLWFYLYLAYDYNAWAVLPCRLTSGKWDRTDEKYKDSIFGADKIHQGGTERCWTSMEMITKIVEGFEKYAKEGSWISAYSAFIRLELGGRFKRIMVTGKDGVVRQRPAAFHPEGGTLPSYDKFRYYSTKVLGADYVREKLFGRLRVEMEDQPVVGSYSEHLMNVGQQANFDSRQVKERPKSYLGKGHLEPLHIVDLIDGATGRTSGIGPSLGSENSRAYRYALFCAAIRKPIFGKIIGYPIGQDEWRGHGLPRGLTSDRGAGCAEEVRVAAGRWINSFELARSNTPKDNSNAEAKHPRSKKKMGAPTYKLSDLTVLELLKREVQRVLLKNRTDSVSARASDHAVVEHGVNTPDALHDYLIGQYRTSLIEISFEDAVRAFLDEVVFEGRSDGKLYLGTRQYHSQRMIDCGLAKKLWDKRGAQLKIKGYAYQLATRYTWIEYQGELIEVEAKGRGDKAGKVRGAQLPALAMDSMNSSLPELKLIDKARSGASGERQQMKPYEVAESHQQFKKETGKEWNSGKTKTGKVTVTREAQDEVRRINGTV